MQLVLHRLEEKLRRSGIFVVIKCRGVEVGHLLIELPLGQPNLADILKLALKVFVSEHVSLDEALLVHDPALNGVVLDDLPRPLAELHGAVVAHLEADGDDCLQIVVDDLTGDLPTALHLNYPEFSDSCFLRQLSIAVYLFQMVVYRPNIHAVQLRHHSLGEPDVFVFIPHLETLRCVAGSSHIGEILCSGGTNGYFCVFLFGHCGSPSVCFQFFAFGPVIVVVCSVGLFVFDER